MPHPYFFCSRTSAGTAVFLLALLPTLSSGAEPTETQAPMSMYFDDSQMVEVATRAPKPLRQVAENVSIITAEEIEAMHAHSVAEIISRESGMLVPFSGREILGDEQLYPLGAQRHQMLMLLDGVRVNLNSNGFAIPNFIPVGIIKRIEIIKGPASSVWGSALGGVVNIITKDAGKSRIPTGNVNISYGEANTRELAADLAGGNEKNGYFVYAGNIDSDGLKNDRYSERNAVYGKMQVNLPHNSTLVASGGTSNPSFKALDWRDAWGIPTLDIYDDVSNDNLWGTLYFDTRFTDRLNLHLAVQRYENDFTNDWRSLGTGSGGPKGDFIYMENWKDVNTSVSGALNWTGEAITANLGVESNRSEIDSKTGLGVLWGPSTTINDPLKEERRGIYTNATYVYGKFSITPGLRYDYHSNSDEFVSPSLGATYQVADDTLLRASVARGFSAPYSVTSYANPDLKPEIIWAYQAGVETFRIPYLTSKLSVFYLDVDDAWQTASSPFTNEGKVRRQGFDLDLRTREFHGLSLRTNFTYTTEDSMGDGSTNLEGDETYSANLIFGYRHKPSGIRAELAGNYIWYNEDMQNDTHDSDDMLWDAMLSRDFSLSACRGDLFLKAHNIFNGNQMWDVDYPNPDRWVEVGAMFKF
ncbi:MAG: TonB-dependent receptor [Proteobacteria bacterium]|nr:TonB-dependent receptor [Pseudomonadota bacterium]MBU1546862.1 TonB-dependent receptor [Pseudomonadota bacterium]MBU2618876.1 TonB-dependent receptor [Pseudomonadota bacterium]